MFSASGTNPYLLVCRAEGGSGGNWPGQARPVPGGTGTILEAYRGTPAKP